MVKNGYLFKSKLWRFMVILPRLKPVDGGYQPSQELSKCEDFKHYMAFGGFTQSKMFSPFISQGKVRKMFNIKSNV